MAKSQDKILSEREVIDVLYSLFGTSPHSAIPFGDDVAAVEIKDSLLAILKTDMFVKKTDAPKGMSYHQMARKAVVATVSDFAAKGVAPLVLLSSLAFPRVYTSQVVEELARGLNEGSKEYGTTIIGGDTNEADDLIIDIIGFGLARKEDIVLRSGAKPRDILVTTGMFGETAAGIKALQEDYHLDEASGRFVNSVYMPKAQLNYGISLSKSKTLTSSIDSSDGLAWSIHELSKASHVGFTVTNLPISKEVIKFAKKVDSDPHNLALYGGEEYNLVCTIEEKSWQKAADAIEKVGGKLFNLGYATKNPDVVLDKEGKKTLIKAAGWEHFTNKIV